MGRCRSAASLSTLPHVVPLLPTLCAARAFRELVELDAEVPTMFEVMLTSAMESKGTDWDMLAALLKACAEESVLQVGGVTTGNCRPCVCVASPLGLCLLLTRSHAPLYAATCVLDPYPCRVPTWRRAPASCLISLTTWLWTYPRRQCRWGFCGACIHYAGHT